MTLIRMISRYDTTNKTEINDTRFGVGTKRTIPHHIGRRFLQHKGQHHCHVFELKRRLVPFSRTPTIPGSHADTKKRHAHRLPALFRLFLRPRHRMHPTRVVTQ
ncbi:hypothetical protein GWI33_005566 [Rhynchophorus ferrugineus]|uniref:Uncharacterized protein n=1 Tax=Rhynchophorus ferrugineus TaxID=354439 RepID=A0A834MJH4_RHYFE|nr:hypothetical protein GWI33_005566 [Rhynchophorus ferrugineus]